MGDTTRITVEEFKVNLFIWEVIITVIVFTAAFYILHSYRRKEKSARERNRQYNSGVDPNQN